jgi:uncharacterized protein YutE (UPF0331/DUF86 family)
VTDETELARQALRGAEGCARRLERSRNALASTFPLAGPAITAMAPETEDDVDAFLKRFEQLVGAIQDDLFKAIAVLGSEDIRALARRDVAELMERLGALPSAAVFRTLVAIRNRLAHNYPDDPDRQARNLNEAFAAVPDLLAAYAAIRQYLQRRLER